MSEYLFIPFEPVFFSRCFILIPSETLICTANQIAFTLAEDENGTLRSGESVEDAVAALKAVPGILDGEGRFRICSISYLGHFIKISYN